VGPINLRLPKSIANPKPKEIKLPTEKRKNNSV
jgi:hypothetical protein